MCKLAALFAGTTSVATRMLRTKLSSLMLGLVASLICVLGGTGLPQALAQTPTADQIDMFRNLPPDQQQSILDSMGGGNAGTSRSSATGVRSDRKLDFPETVRPRLDDEDGEFDDDPLA